MRPSLGRLRPTVTVVAAEARERVAELGVDLGVQPHPEVRGAHLDLLGGGIQAGPPVDDAVALRVQGGEADSRRKAFAKSARKRLQHAPRKHETRNIPGTLPVPSAPTTRIWAS